MEYEIRKYQDGDPDYEAEFWPNDSLAEMRAYAWRLIEEGSCDRVAAYDANGSLVMSVPSTPDAT